MYKNKLFLNGVKYLLKSKGLLKPYRKKHSSKGGSLKSLDNYLLSLVGGVRQMSVKPKSKSKRGGSITNALIHQAVGKYHPYSIGFLEPKRGGSCCGSALKFVR